jgi:hypothetical protein
MDGAATGTGRFAAQRIRKGKSDVGSAIPIETGTGKIRNQGKVGRRGGFFAQTASW